MDGRRLRTSQPHPDNIVPRYCTAPPPGGLLAANGQYRGLPGGEPRREWRGKALPLHTGLCVHQPNRAGKSHYAVTAAVDGVENTRLGPGNSLSRPVAETVGPGEPILYRWLDQSRGAGRTRTVRESQFHLYWAAPPYSNRPAPPVHVIVGLAEGAGPMRIRHRIRDMYYSELLGGTHPYGWRGAGKVVTIVYDAPHDGKGYRDSFNTLKGAGTKQVYLARLAEQLGPWAKALTQRAPAGD